MSAYLDKLCGDGRFGRKAPYVQHMLSRSGRSELTFRQFLTYLRSQDDEECASHWRRQTYLLEGQRIDAFVRLEALHADMTQHAELVGAAHLPILQHRLQATCAASGEPSSVPDMTDVSNLQIAAQRVASGLFPPRASFLTPEVRALIREIYALDFSRLPYDP